MLEFKESLIVGVFNEFEIFIIEIKKSQKSYRNITKKNQKMRRIIVISLFNPKFSIELEDILRTKRFKSTMCKIPFIFGAR